ncbi:MAG: DUF3786 domain-containing protein [Deltaproteobacteria bacterium]|nr:DUF3786 domain-containing protein [Deltaproteobacteria bacterium]MDA8307709.1 DUF3786 domain-containing protein [Deltaproteobacteria bacterium]
MPRIDDYKESFRLAALELKKRDPAALAQSSGAEYSAEKGLVVAFLGAGYRVEIHPETKIGKIDSNEEVALPDQILIAHYLLGAAGRKATGKLITFRQVPDGHFYFDAFQRRARDPFVKFFGDNGALFVKCAEMLGAAPVDNGDYGMEFSVFPHIQVQLLLWAGDEEFPPEATILFDESIHWRLPAEDIAVMSGGLVYRLIGLGRKMLSA